MDKVREKEAKECDLEAQWKDAGCRQTDDVWRSCFYIPVVRNMLWQKASSLSELLSTATIHRHASSALKPLQTEFRGYRALAESALHLCFAGLSITDSSSTIRKMPVPVQIQGIQACFSYSTCLSIYTNLPPSICLHEAPPLGDAFGEHSNPTTSMSRGTRDCSLAAEAVGTSPLQRFSYPTTLHICTCSGLGSNRETGPPQKAISTALHVPFERCCSLGAWVGGVVPVSECANPLLRTWLRTLFCIAIMPLLNCFPNRWFIAPFARQMTAEQASVSDSCHHSCGYDIVASFNLSTRGRCSFIRAAPIVVYSHLSGCIGYALGWLLSCCSPAARCAPATRRARIGISDLIVRQ